MARYYDSKNKGSSVSNKRDRFNDEMRHDSDSYRMSPSHVSDGSYAGELARRTQEMEDAGMIRENRNAIANLPQEVMIKPYPKTGPYMPEDLDDRIEGVDRQMDFDDRKRAEHFYPKKV